MSNTVHLGANKASLIEAEEEVAQRHIFLTNQIRQVEFPTDNTPMLTASHSHKFWLSMANMLTA